MSLPPSTAGAHRCASVSTETSPSLTTVLARLGHACTGVCSTPTWGRDPVWFAWRSTSHQSALVVLDVAKGSNALAMRHLLHDVNVCTNTDRIRVVARRVGDRGRALAALTTATPTPSPRALVLA